MLFSFFLKRSSDILISFMLTGNDYRLCKVFFNPFVSNTPFLYPLKTSENLTIFRYFQGLKKGCIGNKWVNVTSDHLDNLALVY